MRKRILILKACGGSDEPHECNGICEQAQLYGIESVCKCVKNNEDLEGILYSHGLFDYIYLSAHGNSEGFSSEDEKVNMSWQKLAMLLCKSKCMNEDSILMLSCCRGGEKIDGSGIRYFPDLPADLLCAWSETKLDFCRYAYLLRHLMGYHHCICVNQLISVGKNWEIPTSTHATYQCL